MGQAKHGDTVKVHYTGTLDDGAVFDTSFGRDPMEFTVGGGGLIPAFENAVVGMSPGESKVVNVPFAEAYGPHHEEMIAVVQRTEFPDDLDPEMGNMLQLESADGRMIVVTVTSIDDSSVTLDGNHPLAGKDLTFNIELVEVA
jgi:peptidylprolyl isomerase